MSNTDKNFYFPFYPKDWLTDDSVLSLSSEEKGYYIDLLCIDWLNGGFPIDEHFLKNFLKISSQRAKKFWKKVNEKFIEIEGKFTNKKLAKLRESIDSIKLTRSEAGKEGAKKRWQTHGKRIANPIANEWQNDSYTNTKTKIKETITKTPPRSSDPKG